VEELLKNNLGLQVLTDTGWSDFSGLLVKGEKKTVTVKTATKEIVCTLDHNFFTSNFETIEARNLKPKIKILTVNGSESVVSVELSKNSQVYDLFNVEKNHRFYANDILVKNCEFLIFDETLINAITLSDMKGVDPIMRMGQTRWYENVKKGKTYLVALDPSMGTGGDPAAIEVFELPGMVQVAEWQHNNTPVQAQVRILKEICKYITENAGDISSAPKVYYSVENNTLGEAALVSINEIGEEHIPGLFLSEPIRKGHVRKFRKGFNTTHNAKIAACSKLKQLIETNTIKIKSKPLISQLKAFIARGTTFAAKSGERDDLVMSMLLAIRMLGILSDWDPAIYDLLRTGEEVVLPMPILMS
jgi:hypothetical protein